MARCNNCSAPLLPNTQYCSYCGVRNDVDLLGKHDYRVVSRQSERICPECNVHLQTVALELQPPLHIERCSSCFGLFFDPGEVETLLENSVSPVFSVNQELLGNINKDRYQKNKPVKYLECPVCLNMMNRVVFGHKSGVVIDQCRAHGIWLDGGEISHLLEWKKAGGQILHEKKQAELRQRKRQPNQSRVEVFGKSSSTYGGQYESLGGEEGLLEIVFGLIFKVFD
ncbi:MAG: zf-TFIIB domain-containing protein [Methylomonas sp.]|jgi:Zn-finger nucleic acid-binding protein|uniref:TFIIB-type zinc ribbon-containing protein n=1 Tax=Methylomonas sp. TaxID=418 RepID=UPI0025E16BB9|nr:zf-TFIIB domain-containing protein [Methylomonas sp.]MCK9605897.1 zf-TFIIB domain-containing protein [Methylomonas sp.]